MGVANIPWIMDKIPLYAIKSCYVADFLPKDTQVFYRPDSIAMNQKAAEFWEESQATQSTQATRESNVTMTESEDEKDSEVFDI